MRRLILPAAGLAAWLAGCGETPAQELLHHGQGVDRRLTQTVSFADPWGDGGGDALFTARPRAVEVRIHSVSPQDESVQVELLLPGPWGWFHRTYPEADIQRGFPDGSGLRTSRLALDVDGDAENELVLLERRVATRVPLDENGDPVPGAVPVHAGHELRVVVLDRRDGALVETSLTPDPDEAGFAALLRREHGGATNAALQLLAGDWLFNEKRYAEARYRYQVAREWAERRVAGHQGDGLSLGMAMHEPDPDLPEFTWITALLRHSALPPFFRKRF